MSMPLSLIVPAVGSISRSTQFADGRLAAARLADEPEDLARAERERDAVDRVHDAARRARAAPPTGKCLTRPSTSSDRLALLMRRRSPRVEAGDEVLGPHLAQLAVSASASARRRAGSGRRTRSRRAARAATARGRGSPAAAARVRAPRTGRGIAPSSPIVYGCCGCANRSSTGASSALRPGVHDEHAVGDVGDDAEVVRDQDDRGAEPLADVAHQVEDPRLDRDVERRRRLVGDQHLRVAGERDRDHHALAHAAGELVRILVEPPLAAPGCRRAPAARSRAPRASRRDRPSAAAAPRRSGRRR